MDNGFLPVLELYGRYSKEGEMFLMGAFGGVRIFIYPIKGARPDDRCWRMYFAPRQSGVDRDRARATAVTTPAPTGWDSVHERRGLRRNVGLKDTLAAVGFQAPYYEDEPESPFSGAQEAQEKDSSRPHSRHASANRPGCRQPKFRRPRASSSGAGARSTPPASRLPGGG